MRQNFRVLANGADITADLSDRLVSLTITDEAGETSDKAEIELDDRDGLLALPESGAELKIALGLGFALADMGTFTVDEVGGDFFPATMRISAKAANMLGEIRARRNRHWKDVTLRDIVEKIAGEHGLKPRVSDTLAGTFYKYLVQTSESDLNLLTRLARELDAVAKPAGQSLIFVPRGEGKAGDGGALPVIPILRSQMQEGGTWKQGSRKRYGKVTAEWNDKKTGTVKKHSEGDKAPELRLRHPYASEAEAKKAAKGALERSKRSSKITLSLAGFWPQLMAEAKVNLVDVRPGLTGEWLVKSVTHSLSGALKTSFTAERNSPIE